VIGHPARDSETPPMDFRLSDDQRMLGDALARFLREQYPFEIRQRIAASSEGASRAMWGRLADLGVLAALFGEGDGGMGGTGAHVALVFEALGRSLVVEPLGGALMAGRLMAACAGNHPPRALLDGLIAGDAVVLFAHEEADTGADPSRVSLRAEAHGRSWRLDGVKTVVPGAELSDAFIVSARAQGVPGDPRGLALFLVPRDAPRLSIRGYPLIDGGRGGEVVFDGVEVGDDALLGTPDEAYPLIEGAIAHGVVALAAESLGAMEVARETTIEYLRTRRQFGVAIGTFQALQHRIADLAIEVEQARSAVINAGAALGARRVERERAVCAAKATVGRVGTLVAEECIQLHGGMGMSWELPLAHYAKRLVMIDHQFGDEDQHLARYIELGRAPSG